MDRVDFRGTFCRSHPHAKQSGFCLVCIPNIFLDGHPLRRTGRQSTRKLKCSAAFSQFPDTRRAEKLQHDKQLKEVQPNTLKSLSSVAGLLTGEPWKPEGVVVVLPL